MNRTAELFERILATVFAIVVMVVLATLVFFVATFVVSVGSGLAGYDPSGDFVVLSAALIVVAVILAGGVTSGASEPRYRGSERPAEDDPTYE